MTETTPDPDANVREAIKGWIADADQEDVMVINYTVVAEVVSIDDSTSPWLKVLSNRGLAPWARLGMGHALVQICEQDLHEGWEG